MKECGFLFTNYTDIYNKVKKDEIDLIMLNKFLDVLKRIEDGELDQHEGSFLVGTILKEMYIDSALKKADKLNEKYEKENTEQLNRDTVKISYSTYKSVFGKK
jgi:hypothetical protein